jgi:hypothetical protein
MPQPLEVITIQEPQIRRLRTEWRFSKKTCLVFQIYILKNKNHSHDQDYHSCENWKSILNLVFTWNYVN